MGTIDAFQRQVWSPQFKQNCFPHRSKMGVLKSFPKRIFCGWFEPLKSTTYSEYPKILSAARHWEDKAKATGEDIRKINPIPANIAAGISSLEEKSLGAIAKSGTSPIQDVLKYAEMPKGSGLYFVDSWMSSLSLPLCLTACGATIMLYCSAPNDAFH